MQAAKDAPPNLEQATGYVTFLRANEPNTGFGGGSTNYIDVDVIFMISTKQDLAFGFQLRPDQFQLVRQAYLALLQEAVLKGLPVTTDYLQPVATPNNNCIVVRIALQNIPVPRLSPIEETP